MHAYICEPNIRSNRNKNTSPYIIISHAIACGPNILSHILHMRTQKFQRQSCSLWLTVFYLPKSMKLTSGRLFLRAVNRRLIRMITAALPPQLTLFLYQHFLSDNGMGTYLGYHVSNRIYHITRHARFRCPFQIPKWTTYRSIFLCRVRYTWVRSQHARGFVCSRLIPVGVWQTRSVIDQCDLGRAEFLQVINIIDAVNERILSYAAAIVYRQMAESAEPVTLVIQQILWKTWCLWYIQTALSTPRTDLFS